MKKIFALMMAVTMGFGLISCSSQTPGNAEAETPVDQASEAATSESTSNTYTVGICQLVQHEALDAATQGFKDALTEEFGSSITFDEQNAQGDPNTCNTIVNSFVSSNVDLILANATPALQSAASGTNEIPILGTSVTEYGVALEISDFNGTVGGNISGTSDLAPLDQQAAMVKELFPDAKNVGLIYCSSEANSQYQVDTVQVELEKLGYTCKQYAFSDSNDLSGESNISEMPIEYAPQFTKKYNADLCEALNVTIPDDYIPVETQ